MSLAAESSSSSSTSSSANSFAITQVDVFDGKTVRRAQNVLVVDGLIDAVEPHLPIPPGVPVTPGAGKMLLPGLIDAHVHTSGSSRSDALRFGVTAELDMFMDWHALADARAQRQVLTQTDKSDLWSAGTLATAAGGYGTESGLEIPTLSEASQAQAWVDTRVAEGSDYIKIAVDRGSPPHPLPTLSPPVVTALVTAAHHSGKLALVHIETLDSAWVAVSAGADALAHIFKDEPADDAFVSLVRQKHMFVIPTLTLFSASSCGPMAASLAKDPAIKPYLSSAQAQMLRAGSVHCAPPELEMASQNARIFHQGGITLLAGTDAGHPGAAHGVSLLGEVELLWKAGLTPEEALAAATSVPAERFGLKDRGHIGHGQRADLVLVDGDPSRDPVMIRRIVGVWKNGYPVRREVAPVSQASQAAQSVPAKYQRLSGPAQGHGAHRPPAVFAGHLIRAGEPLNGGQVTGDVELAGDELFKGEYRPVDQVQRTRGTPDLAKAWDQIYGAGYYSAHVKDNRLHLRSLMVSKSGKLLVTELIDDGGHGCTGAARDSRGNLYKVSCGG